MIAPALPEPVVGYEPLLASNGHTKSEPPAIADCIVCRFTASNAHVGSARLTIFLLSTSTFCPAGAIICTSCPAFPIICPFNRMSHVGLAIAEFQYKLVL
ncbi:MAG: hypothetical protein MK207_14910 [Saprospiraceae bacterium]|uniref:hypothetical protein n=1 Tax=Kordia sp. TaxID=1965332 RepID=UPI0025BD284A|nr:hypothetical protein [Kordia sp.]MCH2023764.1 hypothetical protein [Saprospiraceae bacterium]MCH2196531.1 hypothetical protein [Kordia sp.]